VTFGCPLRFLLTVALIALQVMYIVFDVTDYVCALRFVLYVRTRVVAFVDCCWLFVVRCVVTLPLLLVFVVVAPRWLRCDCCGITPLLFAVYAVTRWLFVVVPIGAFWLRLFVMYFVVYCAVVVVDCYLQFRCFRCCYVYLVPLRLCSALIVVVLFTRYLRAVRYSVIVVAVAIAVCCLPVHCVTVCLLTGCL